MQTRRDCGCLTHEGPHWRHVDAQLQAEADRLVALAQSAMDWDQGLALQRAAFQVQRNRLYLRERELLTDAARADRDEKA